jgi:hypothetical protein
MLVEPLCRAAAVLLFDQLLVVPGARSMAIVPSSMVLGSSWMNTNRPTGLPRCDSRS